MSELSYKYFRELLSKLPNWAKVLAFIATCLFASIAFFTACGTTTRVKASTSDGSNLSISIENKSDTDSETNVNPNIPITIEKTGINSYSIVYRQ